MSNLSDKTIVCCDCGREFEFTAGEQRFFQENNYNEPRRCRGCRRIKKERKMKEESN